MTGFSKRTANEQLNQEADKVHRRDVGALLDRQQAIEDKVRNSGKLSRFSTDIRLMFSMLRTTGKATIEKYLEKHCGDSRRPCLRAQPLDLIPDLLLGFGLLDDAGVVAACLALVESDLLRYAAWQDLKTETQTLTDSD